MATNKNQHFVPRCYLRPFSINSKNIEINLYNIDRKRLIQGAAVKHQCSKNYFYGDDLKLEKALQKTEGKYASVLRDVLSPNYYLSNEHRDFFRFFWLLQFLRTESAAKRAVELTEDMTSIIGDDAKSFSMNIKEAVQHAMHAFVQEMHILDDLKVVLFKNRTSTPFYSSDTPAVLTNRWYLEDSRAIGSSFGLKAAGNIFLIPLSPKVLCLGYDGSVYSVPHRRGWVDIKNDSDIHSLNQHQFLNCSANIFTHNSKYAQLIHSNYLAIESNRPNKRHKIHYAILDEESGESKRYRVVNRNEAGEHAEAIIHSQIINAKPSMWPRQIKWRKKGVVFTNDTATGYVRQIFAESQTYRKVLTR